MNKILTRSNSTGMMRRSVWFAVLVGIFLAGLVWMTPSASAQEGTNVRTGPLLIQCDTELVNGEFTNPCGIDDFLNQFVVLAQWGLSIVAVLAVLMIVYGGFQWITAGGRPSKVEDGKRVVQGTIIGVIISLMAYVIVNFVVSAITGTTGRWNPFGAIATVFQNPEGSRERINRPFSGSSSGSGSVSNCHTLWENGCTNQIRCADRDERSGAIRDLQSLLQAKGCNCGPIDGCFGNGTANCVRAFQLANKLPPTGMVDQRTRTLIESSLSVACSTETARIGLVQSRLPTYSVDAAAGKSSTTLGCCLVKGSANNTTVTLQCASQVSERTCAALGSSNKFFPNETCFQNSEAAGECGFCLDAATQKCFQATSNYWCTGVVQPNVTFRSGPCFGSGQCPNGCDDTLYGSSPF